MKYSSYAAKLEGTFKFCEEQKAFECRKCHSFWSNDEKSILKLQWVGEAPSTHEDICEICPDCRSRVWMDFYD